jgi:hypothetical protein
MKKLLITPIVLLFLVAGARLQAQQSNLTVYTETKENFTLIVNGQRINAVPAQHVRVTGLQPSKYRVEAIFTTTALPKQGLIIPVEGSREITYTLTRSTLAGPLSFNFLSEVAMGYMPIAPRDVTTVIYTGPLNDPGTPVVAEPAPVVVVEPVGAVVQPVETIIVVEKPDPMPGYKGPIGCPNPMDGDAFMDAKQSISTKKFSDTKMEVAKQITRNNCLLTSQVKDVMSEFTFESQKLEYAKFAYPFTYDRGNYYKVNDMFGYESSVRELEKFLQEK